MDAAISAQACWGGGEQPESGSPPALKTALCSFAHCAAGNGQALLAVALRHQRQRQQEQLAAQLRLFAQHAAEECQLIEAIAPWCGGGEPAGRWGKAEKYRTEDLQDGAEAEEKAIDIVNRKAVIEGALQQYEAILQAYVSAMEASDWRGALVALSSIRAWGARGGGAPRELTEDSCFKCSVNKVDGGWQAL